MSDSPAVHQEYPITLAHPHYARAQSIPIPGTGRKMPNGTPIPGSEDMRGIPERYAPVTADSADDVEYYKAQGYEIVGHSDPSAYVRSMAAPLAQTHEAVEYPKWVRGKLVNSKAEEKELLSAADDGECDKTDQADEPVASVSLGILERLAELEAANRQLQAKLDARPVDDRPRNKGGRPRKIVEAQA